jgi:hypothetical protein
VMEDDQADTGMPPPVFTFPSPGGAQPGGGPVFTPVQGNTPPVISLQPGANGPTIYNFVPGEEQPQPQTAPTPGMIQMPTQPTNTRPVTPPRPPGSE